MAHLFPKRIFNQVDFEFLTKYLICEDVHDERICLAKLNDQKCFMHPRSKSSDDECFCKLPQSFHKKAVRLSLKIFFSVCDHECQSKTKLMDLLQLDEIEIKNNKNEVIRNAIL